MPIAKIKDVVFIICKKFILRLAITINLQKKLVRGDSTRGFALDPNEVLPQNTTHARALRDRHEGISP